ncbi:hypothetical protein Pcinc_037981, partial [Petrolisthes cinctipes]
MVETDSGSWGNGLDTIKPLPVHLPSTFKGRQARLLIERRRHSVLPLT